MSKKKAAYVAIDANGRRLNCIGDTPQQAVSSLPLMGMVRPIRVWQWNQNEDRDAPVYTMQKEGSNEQR